MAKALLGITVALLLGTSVLGFLNKQKLSDAQTEANNVRDQIAEIQQSLTQAEEVKTAAETAAQEAKAKEEQAQSDLTRAQQELQAAKNSAEQLQTQITERNAKVQELEEKIATGSGETTTAAPDAGQLVELEAKVKEFEGQIAAAEEEKTILTEKVASAQSEAENLREAENKRVGGLMSQGLRGRIEAYNPAYNFAVLNIGDRQGVVRNAEMVVTRGGVMVGKVRISSVYPTNSVADVVRDSVPRGYQIQPGDAVIYPGQ